jgi:hypothetical protein
VDRRFRADVHGGRAGQRRSAWSAAIAVDNTAPAITVTATGAADETIHWAAEIVTVEVSSSTA